MLRKRSRQVTSKQSIVGDQSNNNNNQWIPLEKPTKPTSSFFFTSPKFFKGFFTFNDKSDPMLSPTSILDKNPFSVVANFWVFDYTKISSNNNKNTQKQHQNHAWEQPNNKQGISLALIDETHESNNNNNNNNNNNDDDNAIETKQQKRKLVVFGSQLRIQVPPLPNSSGFPCFSPESPREFGIKTPRNNLWYLGNKNLNSQVHPDEESFNGNESIREIDEDSEDYTCVISHGPNPKTTHIFGNCIVESCCGKIVRSPSFSSKRNGYLGNSIPSQVNFLSFCHHCKKNLGQGRDIYMYRGEKAFCSEECRCQGMLFDGGEN